MADGDVPLTFSGIAVNVKTHETRDVRMTEDEVRDITYEVEHAVCSGNCECIVEPDGICPDGWPSRLLAVGMI
jgi:hypothetical protein